MLTQKARYSPSRRDIIITGALTGLAGVVGLPLLAQKVNATNSKDKKQDVEILNKALYYEHQAIWAYNFAAGKLSNSDVGKAILALALRNQADHKQHRDTLASAIESLGGMPTIAQSSYDVSPYLQKGEGSLDSDVNIALISSRFRN